MIIEKSCYLSSKSPTSSRGLSLSLPFSSFATVDSFPLVAAVVGRSKAAELGVGVESFSAITNI